MENVVKELFNYSKIHHKESEAVIKIALLVMHCDQNISNSEIKLLDRIIFISKFDNNEKVAQLVSMARLEIMEVLNNPDKLKKYIDDCVVSIKTNVIKNSLIKMAELIANSDKDYSKDEKEVVDYLSYSIKLNH
ncbi:MAG: hypothetical protein HND53_00185 [Proteobacteria bacterium]|nr:hypothetical protein [Pseudomonadota bacterium]NOG58892.1 hypothetical protein [Pseudomonadota bacterium]